MRSHVSPSVIVTGSSGLLGTAVCSSLAERGYDVYGFDYVAWPDELAKPPRVHAMTCDLTDDDSIRSAVGEVRRRLDGRLASIVHLAAYYDFSGEPSPLYQQVTVQGTDRLLNAVADFELEQFVFSSTMLVHRPCQVGAHLTEQDPLEAKWPYPQSKIETENIIVRQHPHCRSVLLRIAGVYTDWGTQPTLVQQIKRIYEKDFQGYFFPGDDETGQSGVYIDDAVDAIVRTVERRGKIEPATPILIGEPDPPAYALLQDRIGQLIHGREWASIYVPPTVAKLGATVSNTVSGGAGFIKPYMIELADDHYALEITRARELLGWEPQHRLLDQLPTIIGTLLKDPQQWYRKNGLEQ